mmetsp:Transcript_23180/g.54202  ORF Transcript_23180/g.54202 Transcript_23180/m.54202 type:complete len:200 (-) Transcript_23180:44-643(-)|eukprot:CAMPEP_0114546730 /NCGR_PEP_ID=MMETSP0114-20121206/4087_1 /TAXON_ID=31324 /ORGANISM="Goniomonas sp, Strain m" /LENGTH=199 /DNA_ID=CAMNT_0001731239 /DNA_START=15 /DNA_END=614 /DNA_ORIENTATION=+
MASRVGLLVTVMLLAAIAPGSAKYLSEVENNEANALYSEHALHEEREMKATADGTVLSVGNDDMAPPQTHKLAAAGSNKPQSLADDEYDESKPLVVVQSKARHPMNWLGLFMVAILVGAIIYVLYTKISAEPENPYAGTYQSAATPTYVQHYGTVPARTSGGLPTAAATYAAPSVSRTYTAPPSVSGVRSSATVPSQMV